jgi:hypothetical protein
LESINFISDSLFLLKFSSSDNSGILDYWTVIDKFGQIKPLPIGSEQYLKWSYKTSGQSRLKPSGTTLVLIGGQKGILSMGADDTYEESMVVVIEFNRIGEVTHTKTFQREDYDDELKAQIRDKLILSKHLGEYEPTDDPQQHEA